MSTATDLCEFIDRIQRSDDSLVALETGYALYEAAASEGLIERGPHGQGTVARWVGELVSDGRLTHGPLALGVHELPPGVAWSDSDLQSRYRYRLTPEGRADAETTRRMRHEDEIEHLLTAVVDDATVARLGTNSKPALSHHLGALRAALQRNDAPASIGAAKELVEAAASSIIDGAGDQSPARATLAQMYRQALSALGRGDSPAPGFDMARGSAGLVGRLADLRNDYGTGHGRTTVPPVDMRDARLAARVAIAATEYLFASDLAGTATRDRTTGA